MEKIKEKIPCEVYSRVVGYIRPINQWNRGKRAEFYDRVMLKFEEQNLEGRKNETARND